VSVDVAIALAGITAGALIQSATGFGFALVAAPLCAASIGPVAAVPTVAVAGEVVNVLTLAGERRRPQVLGRAALVLIAAGVPGMVLGAIILDQAAEDVLRVLVAVVVIASVLAVVREQRRPAPDHPEAHEMASAVGAGFVAGTLATVSGINGPPLLAHLHRIGANATQVRDTLAVIFLATGALTIAALAAVGALHLPDEILLLSAGAGVGQLLGRIAFAALEHHRVAATRFVLALSVAAALVPAVQAVG
jgi:uncharacterized protein